MKALYLLRHAKSSWAIPEQSDHERTLNGRGRREAPLMGRYLADKWSLPDLVLCSTATRARETFALAGAGWRPQPSVLFEDGLYLASAEQLASRVGRVEPAFQSVLLVAHNDGLHHFAMALALAGEPSLRSSLYSKFPTAALAVYQLPDGPWGEASLKAASLVDFRVPGDLDGED